MNEITRAYAILGVSPGASLDAIRKSYKALARKWHPDRYAGDPQGQAEANLQMRAINDAFRSVVTARASRAPEPAAGGATDRTPTAGLSHVRREPELGRRLTREEIDRIVEAMKGDGPFDWPWAVDDEYFSTAQAGSKVRAGCLAALGVFPLLALADLLGLSEKSALFFILAGCVTAFALLLRVLPRK